MNIYQEGFRDDILSSIFKLTSKIWLKITGIYVINSIVGIIIFILRMVNSMLKYHSVGWGPSIITMKQIL